MNELKIIFIVLGTIFAFSLLFTGYYFFTKYRDKSAKESLELFHLRMLALAINMYSDEDPNSGKLIMPPSLDFIYNRPSECNIGIPPSFIYDNIVYCLGEDKKNIDYEIFDMDGHKFDDEVWFYYPRNKNGDAYIGVPVAIVEGRVIGGHSTPATGQSTSDVAQEHVSPTHFPLGTIPIKLVEESWLCVFIFPATIIAMALVLWACIRPPVFVGHLWRGIILYIVARAFEEVGMLFACPLMGWMSPGWTSSSLDTFGSLGVCLIAGLIPSALLGLLLYRGSSVSKWRRLTAVVAATTGGYLVALASALLIGILTLMT